MSQSARKGVTCATEGPVRATSPVAVHTIYRGRLHWLPLAECTAYLGAMTVINGRERLRLYCALGFWAATYLLFVAWNQVSEFPHAPWQMRRALSTGVGALLFFGFTRLFDRTAGQPLRRRTLLLIGAALACCFGMVFVRAAIDLLIVPAVGETPSTWPRHFRFGLVWTGYFAGGVLAFMSFAREERQAGSQVTVEEQEHGPPAFPNTMWVSRGRETVRVDVDTIDWVEAEGDYVRLHAQGSSGLLRGTLSGLEAQLDPRIFARVHRSAICRRTAVAAMVRKPSGALAVRLNSGQEVPVGRSYRDVVAEMIGTGKEQRRAPADVRPI